MDDGYLEQDYYRVNRAKIPLEGGGGRPETFGLREYSWTEHICRKWGQWHPDELIRQLELRGFHICRAAARAPKRRRAGRG